MSHLNIYLQSKPGWYWVENNEIIFKMDMEEKIALNNPQNKQYHKLIQEIHCFFSFDSYFYNVHDTDIMKQFVINMFSLKVPALVLTYGATG